MSISSETPLNQEVNHWVDYNTMSEVKVSGVFNISLKDFEDEHVAGTGLKFFGRYDNEVLACNTSMGMSLKPFCPGCQEEYVYCLSRCTRL